MSDKPAKDADTPAGGVASEGNRQRQAVSRRNITHPIQWSDPELEKSYNVKRDRAGDRRSALKSLHAQDE